MHFIRKGIKREKIIKMSLNLNIKQVKGNLQRLFDKNLTDLVRGLRNNKDNEVRMTSDEGFVEIFSNYFTTSSSNQSDFSNFHSFFFLLFLYTFFALSIYRQIISHNVSKRLSKNCELTTSV